jgi:hypothetical protein
MSLKEIFMREVSTIGETLAQKSLVLVWGASTGTSIATKSDAASISESASTYFTLGEVATVVSIFAGVLLIIDRAYGIYRAYKKDKAEK